MRSDLLPSVFPLRLAHQFCGCLLVILRAMENMFVANQMTLLSATCHAESSTRGQIASFPDDLISDSQCRKPNRAIFDAGRKLRSH
jgi:hypothetical protein